MRTFHRRGRLCGPPSRDTRTTTRATPRTSTSTSTSTTLGTPTRSRACTGTRTRARTLAVLGALTALATAVMGGCAGPGPSATTTPAPSAATPAPAPSPAPTPTADPTPRPTPEPVRTSLHAGAVDAGVSAGISGEGPAEVGFTRRGEFAVVVALDCTGCGGDVVLTSAGRGTPWLAGAAPFGGAALVDIFTGSDAEQSVLLDAVGPWSLTFTSWNDLPGVQGQQSGTGSTVLALADSASGIEVTFEPVGPGSRFSGRGFSAVALSETGSPVSVLFGDTAAFTERYDLPLPGILAITADGPWTVTPLP